LRALAAQLGVSLTPVRDAINLLAADGLVAVSPRQGTVVTALSSSDAREIYQLRLMLEPAAAELAATSLTADELASLGDLVRRLEGGSRERFDDVEDYQRHLAIDLEFHAVVVGGARNQRLDGIYRSLQAGLTITRAMFPITCQREEAHRRILEALQARDGDLAREETAAHLRAAQVDVLRHLRAGRMR
jgi:DNA-binding GntR family transcriptional regulator